MDHVDHGSVLVTGGSGYLAGWIVVALLKEGRRVRATVRDMARTDAVRASLARHAPVDRLTFYAADLLADAGWDAATEGTEHVIHVASPMPVREYKDQDLVAPAREGTRRVLSAAHRAGVRHVVMTSSVVAARSRTTSDAATDESVWTDLSDTSVGAYPRSKTLAERDAWELTRAWGGVLTLTTILPGMVQGPALGPDVSGSLELLVRMLRGKVPLVPRVSFAPVDTRDVVDLHVRALSDPRVRDQRVIAAVRPLWMSEIAAILKARFGARAAKVSTRAAPDLLIRAAALISADARFLAPDLGKQRCYSRARAEALLGRPLRSGEEAIKAGAESLMELGVV